MMRGVDSCCSDKDKSLYTLESMNAKKHFKASQQALTFRRVVVSCDFGKGVRVPFALESCD
jgi:hypothetical protein